MVVLFVGFIKHEPIMYTISKGDYQSSLSLIEKIYHKNEDRTKIIENLKCEMLTSKRSCLIPTWVTFFANPTEAA